MTLQSPVSMQSPVPGSKGWDTCPSRWGTWWYTQSAFYILKFYSSVFSYVKGIYAFGLMETNFYDRAEKLAKEV